MIAEYKGVAYKAELNKDKVELTTIKNHKRIDDFIKKDNKYIKRIDRGDKDLTSLYDISYYRIYKDKKIDIAKDESSNKYDKNTNLSIEKTFIRKNAKDVEDIVEEYKEVPLKLFILSLKVNNINNL